MSEHQKTPLSEGTGEGDEGVEALGQSPLAEACSCPSCNLYRWYPPLLVLSTIMAGIFCWMYVSKPVFVSPSGGGESSAVQPAVDHGGGGGESAEWEPSTASLQDRLDPGLGGLPGEEVVPAGAEVGRPAGASPQGGVTKQVVLKPVVVGNKRGSLFTKMPVSEGGVSEAGQGSGGGAAVHVRITRPSLERETSPAGGGEVQGERGADGKVGGSVFEVVSAEVEENAGARAPLEGGSSGENEEGSLVDRVEQEPRYRRLDPSFMAEFSSGGSSDSVSGGAAHGPAMH